MHNCAEGFDAGFDNEFVVFLKYARRSASEIQSQIYLALDRKYVDESAFKQIYDKATEAKRKSMLSSPISEEAGKEKSLPNESD
jgi:four helix bundle protein